MERWSNGNNYNTPSFRVVFKFALSVSREGSTNKKGEADDLAVKWVRIKLIASRDGCRQHVDPLAVFVELHLAANQREQGPVAARADVLSSDEFGATLADQDAAGGDNLSAKSF